MHVRIHVHKCLEKWPQKTWFKDHWSHQEHFHWLALHSVPGIYQFLQPLFFNRVELSLLKEILCFFLITGLNSYSQCSALNQRFSLDASDAYPPLLKRTLLHITEPVASIQNLPSCKEWCCQTDWSFSNNFCSTFVMKMLKITQKRKGTDLESWDNKIQRMTKNHTIDTCNWKSYRENVSTVLEKNGGKWE